MQVINFLITNAILLQRFTKGIIWRRFFFLWITPKIPAETLDNNAHYATLDRFLLRNANPLKSAYLYTLYPPLSASLFVNKLYIFDSPAYTGIYY